MNPNVDMDAVIAAVIAGERGRRACAGLSDQLAAQLEDPGLGTSAGGSGAAAAAGKSSKRAAAGKSGGGAKKPRKEGKTSASAAADRHPDPLRPEGLEAGRGKNAAEEPREDEDPVEEIEVGPGVAESAGLSITDVRTLTDPGGGGKLEEQVNFCESSEDFPSPYEGLEEASPLASGGLGVGGSSSSSFQPRGSLLPMDMQGNHVVVFPAGSGSAAPAVEHGAVQLAAGSGDGNKIFMCHCGKAFSHKSMRDRHVNMHLNLRPFDCPVCNKKFKMKHHLTEHMKTHTGLKPYECDVCAKKFMWRDSFMRHKGHCERRHRLGPGATVGGVATNSAPGVAKKEGSSSPIGAEAEWGSANAGGTSGRSPRSELSFAGSNKI